MKNRTSAIVCFVMFAQFVMPVTASIPSFLRSLGIMTDQNSEEETQPVPVSIPALCELPGIRLSALVIDLPSGKPLVLSGNGVFPFEIPEVFVLADAIDMLQVDSIAKGTPRDIETIFSSTADDIARALMIIHSGMDIPSVMEILENPDMGEGQASSVGEGWDLYGWVDSGEKRKSFALIAISPDGRELGLILLSDDLCCEEKGDLAMMLLWNAAVEF